MQAFEEFTLTGVGHADMDDANLALIVDFCDKLCIDGGIYFKHSLAAE